MLPDCGDRRPARTVGLEPIVPGGATVTIGTKGLPAGVDGPNPVAKMPAGTVGGESRRRRRVTSSAASRRSPGTVNAAGVTTGSVCGERGPAGGDVRPPRLLLAPPRYLPGPMESGGTAAAEPAMTLASSPAGPPFCPACRTSRGTTAWTMRRTFPSRRTNPARQQSARRYRSTGRTGSEQVLRRDRSSAAEHNTAFGPRP